MHELFSQPAAHLLALPVGYLTGNTSRACPAARIFHLQGHHLEPIPHTRSNGVSMLWLPPDIGHLEDAPTLGCLARRQNPWKEECALQYSRSVSHRSSGDMRDPTCSNTSSAPFSTCFHGFRSIYRNRWDCSLYNPAVVLLDIHQSNLRKHAACYFRSCFVAAHDPRSS